MENLHPISKLGVWCLSKLSCAIIVANGLDLYPSWTSLIAALQVFHLPCSSRSCTFHLPTSCQTKVVTNLHVLLHQQYFQHFVSNDLASVRLTNAYVRYIQWKRLENLKSQQNFNQQVFMVQVSAIAHKLVRT